MIRTLLVGAGVFVDALYEGLEAQGHAVAVVVPLREPSAGVTPYDLDTPAAGLKVAAGVLGCPNLVIHVPAVPEGPTDVIDQTVEEWIAACEAPLDEAVAVVRSVQPLLAGRSPTGGGRLVWVLPTTALSGSAGFVATGAACEGIRALAKGTAKQWGADGATTSVLLVDPGVFFAGCEAPLTEGMRDPALASLGRVGDPASDLAPLLDLLADPRAAFTTGGTIVADGGTWMAL